MISPVLERLTSDATVKTGSGKALDLVTVDTDSQTTLAQEYQVRFLIGLLSHPHPDSLPL